MEIPIKLHTFLYIFWSSRSPHPPGNFNPFFGGAWIFSVTAHSIPRVELWPWIQTVRLKSAKLCTPESFSLVSRRWSRLLWSLKLLVCLMMKKSKSDKTCMTFVKVYRNFTSVLLCTHGWFVVPKCDFKLFSCGLDPTYWTLHLLPVMK